MINNMIIYSKQTGKPSVPVTVRIDWLSDGTIKPRLYWMPDGSCYEVKHVLEMTPLACLKHQSDGIRFRVISVILKNLESNPGCKFSRHETYLYFADNWFCGRNIVDDRYGHSGKEFIPVTLDVFPNGEYELIYFKLRETTRFMVEKTISVEPRGSYDAGGIGICHKVEARQINLDDEEDASPLESVYRKAALFFELNKWFIVVKR